MLSLNKRNTFIIVMAVLFYIAVLLVVRNESLTFCIDSNYVNKVDIVKQDQIVESVWACSVENKNKSSVLLEKYKNIVFSKSEKLVSYLNEYFPVKNNLYIQIDTENPLKYFIKENTITIGKGLVESEGHLERAIIKTWILNIDKENSKNIGLFEEALVDLVYFAIHGNLNIEDPSNGKKISIELQKWPQVIQNLDHYCESVWKLSDDFSKCSALNSENEPEVKKEINIYNRNQLVTSSLRPLLSSSLILSYMTLSQQEKADFFKNLPSMIKNKIINKKNILNLFLIKEDDIFESGLGIIKLFADYFSLDRNLSTDFLKKFVFNVNRYLNLQGVNKSVADAQFDYVIDVPDIISNTQSKLFSTLRKASLQNKNIQIALRDKNSVWILPSKTPLSRELFDKITAFQMVYFACPILKTIDINQFVGIANKVLLIKGCDQDRLYSFDLLFGYGAEEFAKKENKLDIVQFHMASFELKAEELKSVQNYFDIVKKRDVTGTELRALGWQDIQWNDQFKFYRPKAVVDAIEFFRVDTL